MNRNQFQEDMNEKDLLEFLEEEYESADNKDELDFWDPYSGLIAENLELRSKFSYSQSNLADKLKTKQSVISRFENLGRLPSYEFLTRLSKVYGHKLGVTLYGDFMAVVPLEKQELVKQWAKEKNQQTDNFIQELLKEQILKKEKDILALIENATSSNVIEVDFTSPKKSNKYALRSTQDSDIVAVKLKCAEA